MCRKNPLRESPLNPPEGDKKEDVDKLELFLRNNSLI
jgi:hypothetical protein